MNRESTAPYYRGINEIVRASQSWKGPSAIFIFAVAAPTASLAEFTKIQPRSPRDGIFARGLLNNHVVESVEYLETVIVPVEIVDHEYAA